MPLMIGWIKTCLWPTAGSVLNGISGLQFNLLPQDIRAGIIAPEVVSSQMGQYGGDSSTGGPVARPKSTPRGSLSVEVRVAPQAGRFFRVKVIVVCEIQRRMVLF